MVNDEVGVYSISIAETEMLAILTHHLDTIQLTHFNGDQG
jgi:hypothetical protein